MPLSTLTPEEFIKQLADQIRMFGENNAKLKIWKVSISEELLCQMENYTGVTEIDKDGVAHGLPADINLHIEKP